MRQASYLPPSHDSCRRGILYQFPVLEHYCSVEDIGPVLIVVLDHHECGAGFLRHGGNGPRHLARTLRIQVRRGLIKQDEPGPHSHNTGQGQALLLPARKPRGGMINVNV